MLGILSVLTITINVNPCMKDVADLRLRLCLGIRMDCLSVLHVMPVYRCPWLCTSALVRLGKP